MKKRSSSPPQKHLCLGDLILAVSSSARTNKETVAAVADLLESGRVCLQSNGRKVRARIS